MRASGICRILRGRINGIWGSVLRVRVYESKKCDININIEAKTEVTPGDTLIILDEIQEAPRALESLKYFCENAPEYAVVAAGSLLGVAIHEGVSFPVGKVDMLDVRPMSFCEFLEAMGEDLLAEVIVSKNYRIMSDWRERLSFWLKNYYYVGGMPEVVQYFSEHKDYLKVRELQNMILRQYEDDFGKHATSGALARTRMVWNSIPMQLAKENKKFFFGQIKSGARMKDFEIAIEWLLDCGLITKVYKVNKPAMPLKAYIDFSAIKLFLLDVGLLGALSEVDAETILEGNAIFTEFKGALTEQFVLQEIVTETAYTPYYFATDTSTYEIDFMIQKQKDYAIRTSMADYRDEEWLINLPLYAVRNL